jgi:uncharacterized protein (TIGR03435 family)
MLNFAGDTLRGENISMEKLANTLAANFGKPVVDKTDLNGSFNIVLKWTPGSDELPTLMGPPPLPVRGSRGEHAEADPSGPSLFTALQRQLGLRLEPQRVPMTVIVIDHVERLQP